MRNNKIYVVMLGMEYEGYESFTPFSSLEKAEEFANNIVLGPTESIEIVIRKIDEPEFNEDTDYYRSYVKPKKAKKVRRLEMAKNKKLWSPTIELNEIEIENYENFIKALPKKYKNKPIYFRFEHGSGIGTSVYVKCEDHEENITDYGCW